MKPRWWMASMIRGLVRDVELVRSQVAEQRQRLAEITKQRVQTEEIMDSLEHSMRIREDDWWMMGDESMESEE